MWVPTSLSYLTDQKICCKNTNRLAYKIICVCQIYIGYMVSFYPLKCWFKCNNYICDRLPTQLSSLITLLCQARLYFIFFNNILRIRKTCLTRCLLSLLPGTKFSRLLSKLIQVYLSTGSYNRWRRHTSYYNGFLL